MKILRLDIREFGSVCDLVIGLGDGINVISDENGGFVPAFIRFMLYGLPRTRSAGGFDRLSAFSSRGIAEGSMDIDLESEGGEVVRVERYVSSTRQIDDLCIVSEAATGKELWRGSGAGEFLFSVPVAVFDRLCMAGLPTETATLADVNRAVRGILIPPADEQNQTKALNRLRGARRRLLSEDGKSGRIPELRAQRDELTARLAAARENAQNRIALNATVEKYTRVTAETADKLADAEDVCAAYEDLLALRRFDDLHADEARLDDLRAQEKALTEKNAYPDSGRYPDEEFASALSMTADNVLRSAEELAEAEKELAAANHSERDNGQEIYADEVHAEGGPDAVAEKYADLSARHRSLRTLGTVLLGAGTAVFVLALTVYFTLGSRVSWITLPGAIIASVLGFAAALGGCAVLKFAADRGKEVDLYVGKFGLEPSQYRNMDPKTAAAQIRRYASFCVKVRSDRNGRRTRQRELSAAAAEKRAWFDQSRADGKKLLAETGVVTLPPSDESFAALLRSASETAFARAREMNDLRGREAALSASISALRRELSDRSEEKLRGELTDDMKAMLSGLDYDALKFKRGGIAAQLEAAETRLEEARRHLAAIEASAENPARVANDLGDVARELNEAEASLASLTLAQTTLEEAPETLLSGVLPFVRTRSAELLRTAFGSRYGELTLDEDFGVTGMTENGRPLRLPLRGKAADAADLAVRLALIETLFRGEKPPVMLNAFPPAPQPDENGDLPDAAPADTERLRALAAAIGRAAASGETGAAHQAILFAPDAAALGTALSGVAPVRVIPLNG